jgi:2,3-bisphosphoglycerate-dependent phosphoglycerate mutase
MKDRKIVLETLKEKKIDAFLCSPYRRSIETISPTAEFFKMEIKTDERFRERKSGVDPRDHCAGRWADFSYAEEGGECLASVQKRNIEALTDVLREYRGKNVVIGSHGTALSAIINYYDSSFGYESFMKIVKWLPFVVEMKFDGERFLEYKILSKVEK